MKYIVIVIFIFLSVDVLSQEKRITGTVIDNSKKTIALANIQLIDKNKIISYTQSNDEGNFSFVVKNISSEFRIKISHISYETKETIILNFDPITITLDHRISTLNEIIVEAKAKDIIEKGDTLKYNLQKLLVGTEQKLKDVIEKLPGLKVDNNGKIRYNGKTIDNLLLDGDEFFKNNHQLATENLSVEMIEKIELLKNYQDLSSINGFENNGQIAINIGLKKSFKETFINTFDAEGGIKERYKLHNNLFNFGSKYKFNLISDSNNLNESVISPIDYIELRKTTGKNLLKDKITIGREVFVEQNIPPFIFAKDNIKEIYTKNNTLNFAKKITKNKRLEFISIFNQTKQYQQTTNFQTYFDDFSSNIMNLNKTHGSSFFTANFIKFQNKINDKTYFESNAYIFHSLDNQIDNLNNNIVDIQKNTLFENKSDLKSTKFGFNTIIKSKFSNKIILEGVLYNDINFSKNIKNLFSNEHFIWFNSNKNTINQNTNFKNISFGGKAKAIIKFKNSSLELKMTSLTDIEFIKNKNSLDNIYNFDDTFYLINNNLSLLYASKLNDKINFNTSIDFTSNKHTLYNKFNENINAILPNINLSYKITSKLNYSLGYEMKLNNPSIYNFISGNIIENYRTVLNSNTLISEKMLTDNYNSGFHYVNISKYIFSTVNFSFSSQKKVIGTNFINTNYLTEQYFTFLDYGKNSTIFGTFSKKLSELPISFDFSLNHSYTQNKVLSNDIVNKNKNIQNEFEFNLKSYFKDHVNFNLGLKNISTTTSSFTGFLVTKNKLQTYSPFLQVDGTLFNKKIIWKTKATYHNFYSTFVSSKPLFDLSFKINFNIYPKVNLYLHGSNILNIKDSLTKNDIMTNSFFVNEIVMTTLSGFLNYGISFSF